MPIMYFIGVTTASSSINSVFPRWGEELGLSGATLVGMDFKPHDDPSRYREAVTRIKRDPDSHGALVTTHKMDLYAACHDLFDHIDPLAQSMGEIGSIYKRDGQLCGRAVDPENSGKALAAFLPENHWQLTGGETAACILGAGGASVALSWHLLTWCTDPQNRPAKLVVSDINPERLDHMRAFHSTLNSDLPVEYQLSANAEDNDALVNALPAGSLVVNATGLGKDAPGSPLTDNVSFPQGGYVWEFNYRGNLVHLDQARSQKATRSLHIEDGWTYFIHGWSSVIADVFDISIPSSGTVFDRLSAIAGQARK
jgi:shikimate 5-dehydrogenase